MKIQLEKVCKQIKKYCENLTYNGLNLVTQESIREIEFFLQNASQLESFRLATSLRYLHVELKRFLDNSPAFNIERYVFFLSNCWLLSRASISFIEKGKDNFEFSKKLMGKLSETKIMSKLLLRLTGIEKVVLEGTMIGLIFYFMSLFGKTRGSILKWNKMYPYKKGFNPEVLFQTALPNSEPPCALEKILSTYFETENIPLAIKEGIIFLEKNPESRVFVEDTSEDAFSITKLEKFYFGSEDIYKMLMKDHVITPFDLPASFLDYIYIKQVQVIGSYKEGEDKRKTPVYVYPIDHEKNYPFFIRIPDKEINKNLVTKFNDFYKKSTKIDGLFSKLVLERGQLGLYPLSIIEDNQIIFPSISKFHPLDNREFLKQVYKVKQK